MALFLMVNFALFQLFSNDGILTFVTEHQQPVWTGTNDVLFYLREIN
jgi:hypothetical protein